MYATAFFVPRPAGRLPYALYDRPVHVPMPHDMLLAAATFEYAPSFLTMMPLLCVYLYIGLTLCLPLFLGG